MADFEPNSEGKVVPPKSKGTVRLAGYTVQMLQDGEVGIKLEGNEAQRVWLLRADSTDDVVAWTPIFQRACKDAEPPSDPDPAIHGAFMEAYKRTRSSQYIYGSWKAWGCEEDMLGDLVNQVLNKRIMYDIYNVSASRRTQLPHTAAQIKRARIGAQARAHGRCAHGHSAWKTLLHHAQHASTPRAAASRRCRSHCARIVDAIGRCQKERCAAT